MQRILIFAAAVAAVLTVAPSAPAAQVPARNCVVSLLDKADVPAQEQGVLKEVLVREGQQVEAGEILAKIDDMLPTLQRNVAQAELEAANKKSKDMASVEYARAGYDVKAKQYERLTKANLRQPGSVAQTDIDLAELERTQFQKQLDKSLFELDIAALEAKVSEANLAAAQEHIRRCEVKAPWAGTVDRLILHAGEWVKPGDPILRLIRMDKLAVKGALLITEHSPERVAGVPAMITVRLTEGETLQFAGKVSGVSPTVDTTGSYTVWVEIANRQRGGLWLLRDGMRAEMTLEVK